MYNLEFSRRISLGNCSGHGFSFWSYSSHTKSEEDTFVWKKFDERSNRLQSSWQAGRRNSFIGWLKMFEEIATVALACLFFQSSTTGYTAQAEGETCFMFVQVDTKR